MKKGVKTGEEKYAPSAHVRKFPEIATPENIAELNLLRLKSLGIRQTESGQKMIAALADKLLLPKKGSESRMREETYSLCVFLYGLQVAIERYLTIQRKRIVPGSKVIFSYRPEKPRRVLKIELSFFIQLEGVRGVQDPLDCIRA